MAQQHEVDVLRMLEEVMSAEIKDAGSILEHLHECRGLGIEILPPDINKSEVSCVFERENVMRLGFSALGFRKGQFLEELTLERLRNGPFQSFQDFCERIETEGVPESFFPQSIKAGVFDSLGEPRAKLLRGVERVLQAVRNAKAEKAANQISLFAMMPADSRQQTLSISLPEVEAWSEELRIEHEKDAMGFSFTEYLMQIEEDAPDSAGESELVHGAASLESSDTVPQDETPPSPLNKDDNACEDNNEEIVVDENQLIDGATPHKSNLKGEREAEPEPEPEASKPEIRPPAPQNNEAAPADISIAPAEENALPDNDIPDYLRDTPLPEEQWEPEAFEETFPESPLAEQPSSVEIEASLERQVEPVAASGRMCIRLTLGSASEDRLLQLRALCVRYPGDNPLLLEFIDESGKTLRIQASRKYHVMDTEEFRQAVQDRFEGVSVFLDREVSLD